MVWHLLVLVLRTALVLADDITIATFDGAVETSRHWLFKKDPVMGVSSWGNFSILHGVGLLDGEVGRMPVLGMPSFIKVETDDLSKPYPDVSHCKAISLTLRSNITYAGYHFAFGNKRPNVLLPRYGYKARFEPTLSIFDKVIIPFMNFTSAWDDESGDPVHSCLENERYCPTTDALKNLKTLGIWAQGATGRIKLEIKSIQAVQCGAGVSNSALMV
eukprot:TRINITY_DN92065_c0_g1_i1.p1 TRINITY_DN92065_c0_g1~~TRINITY_DN92065_c0_g1_i1.p1  ORF type:complete len:217 (+),score=39.73 TRINITY_DN92065_c0_g1_i1:40-690(+)